MSKSVSFLHWFLGLITFTVGLLIITPLAAIYFFDPNDYKTEISSYLSEKSGFPLTIKGDIDLKLFPWIGFDVHQIAMTHSAKDVAGEFIEIEKIHLKVPFNELLRWHLQIEELTIHGLKAHLIKRNDGSSNWADLINNIKEMRAKKINQTVEDQTVENSSPSTNENVQNTTKKIHKKLKFDLTHVQIEDGSVIFEDQKENSILKLNNLELDATGENTYTFPLKAEFDVNSNKPALEGHGKIQGKMILEPNDKRADLKSAFTLNGSKINEHWKEIDLSMNISALFSKSIDFEKIDFKTDQLHGTGNIHVPLNTNPITFYLRFNELNIDKLESKKTNRSSTTSPATQANKSAPVTIGSEMTPTKKSRIIQGDISVEKVQVKNVHLNQLSSKVKIENKKLFLNSLEANLYDGKLTGQATIELSKDPVIAAQGSIDQVRIQPFLKDFKNENRIEGIATLNFNLLNKPRSGLNGNLKFLVKNGVVHDIDVKYYLASAKSLLKKIPNTIPDSKKTPFDELKGTLAIHDNIVDNTDLVVTSPDYVAKGDGNININLQTIDFKLQAQSKHNDNLEHKHSYPLAIRIHGPLKKPKVEPDLNFYLKMILKEEVQQEIKKHLNKELTGKLDKFLKEASDPEEKDEMKRKLEQKLNKGLKKLFRDRSKDDE